jgi:hypothetical protein
MRQESEIEAWDRVAPKVIGGVRWRVRVLALVDRCGRIQQLAYFAESDCDKCPSSHARREIGKGKL